MATLHSHELFQGRSTSQDISLESLELKKGHRLCTIQYQILYKVPNPNAMLLKVKTNQGARYQVRVMLSHLLLAPVFGDIRYCSSCVMQDQSVALHARRLVLPNYNNEQQFSLSAPLPLTWKVVFGLEEDFISDLEQRLK